MCRDDDVKMSIDLNHITNQLHNVTFDVFLLKIPQDIGLAGIHFYKCVSIDMLLSSQIF